MDKRIDLNRSGLELWANGLIRIGILGQRIELNRSELGFWANGLNRIDSDLNYKQKDRMVLIQIIILGQPVDPDWNCGKPDRSG